MDEEATLNALPYARPNDIAFALNALYNFESIAMTTGAADVTAYGNEMRNNFE